MFVVLCSCKNQLFCRRPLTSSATFRTPSRSCRVKINNSRRLLPEVHASTCASDLLAHHHSSMMIPPPPFFCTATGSSRLINFSSPPITPNGTPSSYESEADSGHPSSPDSNSVRTSLVTKSYVMLHQWQQNVCYFMCVIKPTFRMG